MKMLKRCVVRQARVRIIELRNDLDSLMGDIGKALEGVYSPSADGQNSGPASSSKPEAAPASKDETMLPPDEELLPFAKVNGVAPGSPAADAVRLFILYIVIVMHWRFI